ncbi:MULTISPECIES: hypothetical protein [Cobetia]|uniref:hypothetical protein n=1 Tax=Cobetia TaxID=204286 RepID=UPI0015827149|nr:MULTISPECIES: hypothetical protein [Cobetia]MDI4659572.1 hypothetical protein [Cobetia sp. BMC6]NUJ56121.1 hypothetical protein [Cobetia marina]
MKIEIKHDGSFIPHQVRDNAIDIVSSCLQKIITSNNEFVVNDTIYFRAQRNQKVTTCVMNSATYLSNSFQSNLSMIDGCYGETKRHGQNIDGLITRRIQGTGYKIKDPNRLLEVLHSYIEKNDLPESSIYTLFPMFYGMYVQSNFYDIANLPPETQHLFKEEYFDSEFRLGVEFETGNIASSFRAFNKLFILFQEGYIDAGVFITSTDKANSATRIWPVSNRNGSFQELEKRHYLNQVSLPLICIGFSPDRFDNKASFLGKGMSLYNPTPTGKRDTTGAYDIFIGEDGEEILRPIGIS